MSGLGVPQFGQVRVSAVSTMFPSLFKKKCQGPESNRRHQHFQCCALPTELPWLLVQADPGGLPCLTGLHYSMPLLVSQELFDPMPILNPVSLVLVVENPANYLANTHILVEISLKGNRC